MPPGFSTSVKSSVTNTLSFSMSLKAPSSMPALGAIQTCSATRGPQSPRQRPSSHAKSESLGPGCVCGEDCDRDASDVMAGPGFGCEPAPAGCCADRAGDEQKKTSAALNANMKGAPILVRSKLSLRRMQLSDFPTGFMLVLNRFAPTRGIFAENSIMEVS